MMVPIANLADIPQGEGRLIEAAGTHLAVFHTRDGVFATQPDCPHKQGPLADGLTGTNTVVCPLHDRLFDLRTGAGLNTACTIKTYKLTLHEDGTILLAT